MGLLRWWIRFHPVRFTDFIEVTFYWRFSVSIAGRMDPIKHICDDVACFSCINLIEGVRTSICEVYEKAINCQLTVKEWCGTIRKRQFKLEDALGILW